MEKHINTEKPPILSSEVLSIIKQRLQDQDFLTRGHDLNSVFFGFKDKRYRMFLAENKPVNKKNIGMVLPYVIDRIPKELFTTDKDIELVLTNNTDIFLEPENDKDLKTAPGRRRWYLVKDENGKKVIYWHVRDDKLVEQDDLVGGTDATEMMSFLGLLHILRQSRHKDLKNTFSTIKYHPGQEKLPIVRESTFKKWKNKNINVRLDFKESRQSAVDILVNDLKDRLPKSDGKKPFLLIGNDFSWRLTMFSLFLNGENLKRLRERFKDELTKLGGFISESQLDQKEDLKEFIEKYYLLTLLNKNYHHDRPNDPEIEEIYNQVFSAQNYKNLGYKRLLYGVREPLGEDKETAKRSITGEPVDYWDPDKFSQDLLLDESEYIKKLFKKLLSHRQPILSIPYLNGKISPELAVKLIQANLVDEKVMGFLGKVGFYDRGVSSSSFRRGNIITPHHVREITHSKNELIYPHFFNLTDEELAFVNLFKTSLFTTTPAVTMQSDLDFQGDNDQVTALESEQYYMIEAFKKYGLPTRIIGSFYISDISRKNPVKGAKDNINNSLTPEEGAISVCLTTLFEIIQILRFREEEIKNAAVALLGLG